MAQLMAHSWPGNVRELKNVADRLVLGLPLGSVTAAPASEAAAPTATGTPGLGQQMARFEEILITQALRQHQGDVGAAAQTLQVPRPTLYDKMRKLGIDNSQIRQQG